MISFKNLQFSASEKKNYEAFLEKEKEKFQDKERIKVHGLGPLLSVYKNSEDNLEYYIGGKSGNQFFVAVPEENREEFHAPPRKSYEVDRSALKGVLHNALMNVPKLAALKSIFFK